MLRREIPAPRDARDGEEGFLLLGVIVMVALVLIFLSVAAPICCQRTCSARKSWRRSTGESNTSMRSGSSI